MASGWYGVIVATLSLSSIAAFVVLRHRARGGNPLLAETPTATATRRMAQFSFVPLMLAGTAGIAVVGGIGAWERLVHQRTGRFDLDVETSSASALSALLMLLAAGASLLVAGSRSSRRERWPWVTAAAGLTVLAVDERRMFHERLESAVGADWQLLYLPVFVVGGALGTVLLRALRSSAYAPWLFLAAAALWCLAQLLESVQWDGDRQVDSYVPLMVVEEVAGSLLLALGLLDHARRPLAALGPLRPPRRRTDGGDRASLVMLGSEGVGGSDAGGDHADEGRSSGEHGASSEGDTSGDQFPVVDLHRPSPCVGYVQSLEDEDEMAGR